MTTSIIRASMAYPSLLSPASFNEVFKQMSSFIEEKESFPVAKIKVTDEALLIQLPLAGYSKDKISITATLNEIEIVGQKIDDPESLHACRAFTWSRKDVTNTWDFSSSKSKYTNGLLKITVSKRESSKRKNLKIS